MALTFLSTNRLADLGDHQCALVERAGERYQSENASQIYEAYIDCLKAFEGDEDDRSPPDRLGSAIRHYVNALADLSGDDRVGKGREVAELRTGHTADMVEISDPLVQLEREGVIPRIFESPIDNVLTGYYSAQIAYLFGRYRCSEALARQSVEIIDDLERGAEKVEKQVLDVFRFLAHTLRLEIAFNTGEYFFEAEDRIFGKEGKELQRLFKQLTNKKFLTGFGVFTNSRVLKGLKPTNQDAENVSLQADYEDVANYLVHFWCPVVEPGEARTLGLMQTPKNEPLVTRYLVSRKIRVGWLMFVHRRFDEAKETFERAVHLVDTTVGETKQTSMGMKMLRIEAETHLGRIAALSGEFGAGQRLLAKSCGFFESTANVFAANKAKRYLAEAHYLACDLASAITLFEEVSETSRRENYRHDLAVSQMAIARCWSHLGFQDRALKRLEEVSPLFAEYEQGEEELDCVFWKTAAHARWAGDAVATTEHRSRALEQVTEYKSIYDRRVHESDKSPEDAWWRPVLSRHPNFVAITCKLRIGQPPSDDEVQWLRDRVTQSTGDRPASLATRIQLLRCRQVLQIILIQRGELEPVDVPGWEAESAVCPKSRCRDALTTAVLSTVRREKGWSRAVVDLLLEAQKAATTPGLKEGLLPHLSDISQYFVDRDCFVAILLGWFEAIDEQYARLIENPRAKQYRDVRDVYLGLNEFLLFERSSYPSYPIFTGARNPELWKVLAPLVGKPFQCVAMYDRAAEGGRFNFHVPAIGLGIGWVDGFVGAEAFLKIAWVGDKEATAITAASFDEIALDRQELSRRFVTATYTPIVIRAIRQDGKSRWRIDCLKTANRDHLFELDPTNPAAMRPALEAWSSLKNQLIRPVGMTVDLEESNSEGAAPAANPPRTRRRRIPAARERVTLSHSVSRAMKNIPAV